MRDSNPPFTAKLFTHTLCMTSLIIIMASFQTMGHRPLPPFEHEPAQGHEAAPVPPPETEIPDVQPPESLILQPYYVIQDYGFWGGPPYYGGRGSGGPIPHAGLDDEVEDMNSEDNVLLG